MIYGLMGEKMPAVYCRQKVSGLERGWVPETWEPVHNSDYEPLARSEPGAVRRRDLFSKLRIHSVLTIDQYP